MLLYHGMRECCVLLLPRREELKSYNNNLHFTFLHLCTSLHLKDCIINNNSTSTLHTCCKYYFTISFIPHFNNKCITRKDRF